MRRFRSDLLVDTAGVPRKAARVGVALALACLALAIPLGAQTITEFPIPTANSAPQDIVAGPDGNLWFTELNANQIGRITTAGDITEFSVPTLGPLFITAGSDGNLWFTQQNASQIGRITPAGVVTEFAVPQSSGNLAIAGGPEGNLWFTEPGGNQVGRISVAGAVTEFPIPTIGGFPIGIAAGPDGNLWFAEQNANQIGRITSAGIITEFPGDALRITSGQDGNLWFTDGVGQISRMTTAGVVTGFRTPTGSSPQGIAAGPDGNLWFTEGDGNQIGRIAPPCVADGMTLCLSAGRFLVRAAFETPDGTRGTAHAVTLTPNTGYFWFFDPTNVEVVTKVLPFCADPYNSIWIFAAGLTNVKVDLSYTDTNNGTVVMKHNELGVPFAPVQDTAAFKTCP